MVDRDKFSDYSKRISFLDARIRVQAPTESTEPLPVDFEPGNWDVICQGGKDSYDHSKCVLTGVVDREGRKYTLGFHYR